MWNYNQQLGNLSYHKDQKHKNTLPGLVQRKRRLATNTLKAHSLVVWFNLKWVDSVTGLFLVREQQPPGVFAGCLATAHLAHSPQETKKCFTQNFKLLYQDVHHPAELHAGTISCLGSESYWGVGVFGNMGEIKGLLWFNSGLNEHCKHFVFCFVQNQILIKSVP